VQADQVNHWDIPLSDTRTTSRDRPQSMIVYSSVYVVLFIICMHTYFGLFNGTNVSTLLSAASHYRAGHGLVIFDQR
jgi:hypothetical protein